MHSRRSALVLGPLLLAGLLSQPSQAAITNPSFEADGQIVNFTLTTFPIGWGGAPGGGALKGRTIFVGNTDGSYSAQLYVSAAGAGPGNDQFPVRLTQSVDLTNIDTIVFDAELSPEVGWNPLVVPDFRIGGSVVWTQSQGGVYLDQSVDTSSLTGVHEIEFRLNTTDTGPATASHSFFIDHLRETAAPPRLTSTRAEPHVIRDGVDSFTLQVTTSDPSVSEVHIDLGTAVTQGGAPAGVVIFRDDGTQGDATAGDGIYSAANIELAASPTLLGIEVLRVRDIDYVFPAAPTISTQEDLALGLRVMAASVPIPSVTDLAADARATSHVVSLDVPLLGAFPSRTLDTAALAQRYYALQPDDVDFLLLSHDYGNNVSAGTYRWVRNDVVGIGDPPFDDSATYGSAGVLRGIPSVYFGNVVDFEIWNHELLHNWAVRLDPSLELGDGHWEALARPSTGFGFSGPNSVYDRVELVSGNEYRGLDDPDATPGLYNDLELYLMGLVPEGDVAQPIETLIDPVFQSIGPDVCDPVCATNYVFEANGIASVTLADITTEEGVRSPAFPSAPKDFRGRMIVAFDRTLTDVELAYYQAAAEEYEKASSSVGLTFAAATGGRGTITLPEPSGWLGLGLGGLLLRALGRRRRRA